MWAPPSPGYRGRPSPAASHARGTREPRQVRCDGAGKPTVRRAEFRGGNRMPKKRRPAAERQQETGTERPLLQVAVPG